MAEQRIDLVKDSTIRSLGNKQIKFKNLDNHNDFIITDKKNGILVAIEKFQNKSFTIDGDEDMWWKLTYHTRDKELVINTTYADTDVARDIYNFFHYNRQYCEEILEKSLGFCFRDFFYLDRLNGRYQFRLRLKPLDEIIYHFIDLKDILYINNPYAISDGEEVDSYLVMAVKGGPSYVNGLSNFLIKNQFLFPEVELYTIGYNGKMRNNTNLTSSSQIYTYPLQFQKNGTQIPFTNYHFNLNHDDGSRFFSNGGVYGRSVNWAIARTQVETAINKIYSNESTLSGFVLYNSFTGTTPLPASNETYKKQTVLKTIQPKADFFSILSDKCLSTNITCKYYSGGTWHNSETSWLQMDSAGTEITKILFGDDTMDNGVSAFVLKIKEGG